MKHLADELVKRKHEVTWVEYGPIQTKTILPKEVKRLFWLVQFNDQALTDIFVHRNHSSHEMIWNADFELVNEQTTAWLASIRLCDRLLMKNKDKFDQLAKMKFDTVIIDDLYNPCGLLQAALKGSVFIYWSLTSLRTESAWANQSPSPPSYLPVPGTKLTDNLTFVERTYNFIYYLRALYIHQHIIHSRIDAVFQKHYPGVASAFDIERNASINFVNNPPIFDFARPYMPRVNFVGGLHCRNATALPGALSSFLEGASEKDGFILITTGFTAQWDKAPKQIVNTFVELFRALPNIRFVWQYNGKPMNDLPKNVVTQDWLPQQDLLGYDNLIRISARGAGLLIEKEQLSTEKLLWAVEEIRDKKYKDEMLVFQDMVRDVPYTELTHAAFWVEFIERHQEVPHARSGADRLNVFQYFLVDVILFLVSILAVTIAILVFAIKIIFRIFKYMVILAFNKKHTYRVTKAKKTN
uniref:glucuronosyltransferase n=1 Tax=Heterorhabditis bacteriophora TaxID=37862 RepID=A0A1I7X9T7_HETBA